LTSIIHTLTHEGEKHNLLFVLESILNCVIYIFFITKQYCNMYAYLFLYLNNVIFLKV